MKFEQFTVGQIYQTEPYTMTKEEIVSFAEKFDPHEYHMDETKAENGLFGSLVASGMHSMSIINGQWVRLGILGEDMLGGLGIDARWLRPVYPGDTIKSDIAVLNKRANSDGKSGIVTLQFTGTNQQQEVWAKVKIRIIVATESYIAGDRLEMLMAADA